MTIKCILQEEQGRMQFLFYLLVIAVYPVSRIITISLRPGDQLLSTSLALIPEGATLANYSELLFETEFFRWLLNSFLVSLVVTLTGVAIGINSRVCIISFSV